MLFIGAVMYFGGAVMAVAFGLISCIGFLEITNATKKESDKKDPKSVIKNINLLDICGLAGTVVYYFLLLFSESGETLIACVMGVIVMMFLVYVFTFPKFKAQNLYLNQDENENKRKRLLFFCNAW